MITIQFNNETITLEIKTLQDLLQQKHLLNKPFAIAINRQFIPRNQYVKTLLQTGDVIEIIMPMQGG